MDQNCLDNQHIGVGYLEVEFTFTSSNSITNDQYNNLVDRLFGGKKDDSNSVGIDKSDNIRDSSMEIEQVRQK